MAEEFNFNPLHVALQPLFDKARLEDPDFDDEVRAKESRTEDPKSFTGCCEWILGEAYAYASAHRNGSAGFSACSDAEMISLIKHYYDEDGLKAKPFGSKAKVSVSKTEEEEELTPEEIAEREAQKAEREAAAKAKAEEKARKEAEKKAKADAKANRDVYDMFADFDFS